MSYCPQPTAQNSSFGPPQTEASFVIQYSRHSCKKTSSENHQQWVNYFEEVKQVLQLVKIFNQSKCTGTFRFYNKRLGDACLGGVSNAINWLNGFGLIQKYDEIWTSKLYWLNMIWNDWKYHTQAWLYLHLTVTFIIIMVIIMILFCVDIIYLSHCFMHGKCYLCIRHTGSRPN